MIELLGDVAQLLLYDSHFLETLRFDSVEKKYSPYCDSFALRRSSSFFTTSSRMIGRRRLIGGATGILQLRQWRFSTSNDRAGNYRTSSIAYDVSTASSKLSTTS